MPVPDFSPGEVLTAAAMDSIGLWKVASATVSLGTTPLNIVGVFDSSKYQNYKLVLRQYTVSTSSRIEFKFLSGTTPTSLGYYAAGIGAQYTSDSTLYFQRTNNDARLILGSLDTASRITTFDIIAPQTAIETLYYGQHVIRNTGFHYSFGGVQVSVAAFDGFQIVNTAGTTSLDYFLYGYRN